MVLQALFLSELSPLLPHFGGKGTRSGSWHCDRGVVEGSVAMQAAIVVLTADFLWRRLRWLLADSPGEHNSMWKSSLWIASRPMSTAVRGNFEWFGGRRAADLIRINWRAQITPSGLVLPLTTCMNCQREWHYFKGPSRAIASFASERTLNTAYMRPCLDCKGWFCKLCFSTSCHHYCPVR